MEHVLCNLKCPPFAYLTEGIYCSEKSTVYTKQTIHWGALFLFVHGCQILPWVKKSGVIHVKGLVLSSQ